MAIDGLPRPAPTFDDATRRVSGLAVLSVLVFASLSLWSHFVAHRIGLPLVDGALLAIHEAGHVIVALVSVQASVYGGTLFQLMFPLLFVHHAARHDQPITMAFSGVWLGESLLNVATYMADARARMLPLVGFTDQPEHDWETIFARWGLLQQDLLIANLTRGLAVLTMAAWLGWLLLQWRETRGIERPR